MKRIIAALVCLSMVLVLLSACQRGGGAPAGGDGGAASSNGYKIRVGHVLAPTHPYQIGLEKFKELLEEKTDGEITVEVFHSSQLGNERDMVEGLQLGTVEMTIVSTAPLASFTSDFLVFDLPFIFTDTQTARNCVDSEIGQTILDNLKSEGIIGICYFENGFRSVTNSRLPITKPEDLKGIKIRTMENPIHMDSFRVMGADPTPMAFGELFTALQQKTIDAQENPLAIVDTSKFYEVQDYLSLTEHFYAPSPLLIAAGFYNSLPENLQNDVKDCLLQARDYERSLLDEMNERLKTELVERGMKINEVDKSIFIEAVQPVYDKYVGAGEGKIPAELLDKVRSAK